MTDRASHLILREIVFYEENKRVPKFLQTRALRLAYAAHSITVCHFTPTHGALLEKTDQFLPRFVYRSSGPGASRLDMQVAA